MSDILNLIPAKYAALAAIALPLIGRAYYAIENGGGIVGVWRALMFGTNTPKDK